MTGQGLFLFLVYMSTSTAQLIGSRGVISLKEGVEYRDPETVQASETVASFAREFQEEDDDIAERRSHLNDFRFKNLVVDPKFQTQVPDNVKGRPLIENEIFDFLESRFVEPPRELQFNKFLDEVEVERATTAIRLLPGEGLPPTPRPATRAPNRLVNLQRPSLGSEESVRSQNSHFSTVFGPPTRAVKDNFQTSKGPIFNPPPNNQLDSNQLAENFQDSRVNFRPPQNNLLFNEEPQISVNGQHVIRPFVNLNEGTKFLSGPQSLSISGPGFGFNRPESGGHILFSGQVGPTAGLSISPNVHISSLPAQHGFGGTFQQKASFSGDSFHNSVGLSDPQTVRLSSGTLAGLSSLPPSPLSGGSFHQNGGLAGAHNIGLSGSQPYLSSLNPASLSGGSFHQDVGVSRAPVQQFLGGPDSSLNHGDEFSNIHSHASLTHSGPEFYHRPRLSSGVQHHGFGLGVPGPYGEPNPRFSSGTVGVLSSQRSGFSRLGLSHSLSEGPHHSLSIHHIH